MKRYITELIKWLKKTSESDIATSFNERVNKILENEKDEQRLMIVKRMAEDRGVRRAGKDFGIDGLFQEYLIPDDVCISL